MMRTWAVVKHGAPLELIESPLPQLKGTEVLVQNLYAGVCHSDIHLWKNEFNSTRTPSALGHEIEAELVALGPDVPPKEVQVGGRYLIFPWIGCGARPKRCKMCTCGQEHCCQLGQPEKFADGKTMYGGYSSHVVVPHHRYLIDSAVASGVPDGLACTYMCSGLTAFAALKKLGEPPEGAGDVLIIGCGGLGLQAIEFAKFLFGGAPCAADVSPSAKAAAEARGCKVYDPSDKNSHKEIRTDTRGGFFGAIDFVGSPKTFDFARKSVRNGGCIVLVGLHGGELKMLMAQPILQNLRIQGSLTGSLEDAHEMLQAVQAGAIQPIPHQVRGISEVNQVFEELEAGKIIGRCILRHEGAVSTRL